MMSADFAPTPRSPEARRVFVRQALAGAMRASPQYAVALVELAAACSDFGRVTPAFNWWQAPQGDRGHYLLCHLCADSTAPQGVRLISRPSGRFSGPEASMRWALPHLPAIRGWAPKLLDADLHWLRAEIAAMLAAPLQ